MEHMLTLYPNYQDPLREHFYPILPDHAETDDYLGPNRVGCEFARSMSN